MESVSESVGASARVLRVKGPEAGKKAGVAGDTHADAGRRRGDRTPDAEAIHVGVLLPSYRVARRHLGFERFSRTQGPEMGLNSVAYKLRGVHLAPAAS